MEKETKTEKENEETGKVGESKDSGEGDKSKLAVETEAANAAAERMENAKEELEATEARTRLGGTAEAGSVKEKPKRLTNTEYSDAMEKGEVNPFKEDGYEGY